MYKFRAKSTAALSILSLLALLAFIAVEQSKIDVKKEWYNEKLEAAQLSQKAEQVLKNHRVENSIFIDVVNDPNQTALIGQEFTLVTTDRGEIDAKLSTTNPNFAAVVVQLLKDAGVEAGDNVAVAMSGSFPGLNISVAAAIEILSLNPVTITSVGASNFGANDPNFTWLDMETVLYNSGLMRHRSVAASIGGGHDIGRGLSPEGRHLIEEAIQRNDVIFINESYLENSIERRMEIYEKYSKNKPIKAFINVGGGIASLGNTINGRLINPGLTKHLPTRNFPARGVIIQMGQNGIPIIHLLNINRLLKDFNLPGSPVPLPDPGEGGIFIHKQYNVTITAIATAVLVLVILLIYFNEKRYNRLGASIVPAATPMTYGNDSDDLL
ncbi:MAG TPA: poly-gamma-glutamate system protein [Bacteroidales bacterium]|nr:poly-gamma-glutamate system protein [Bacteroidales bacterium]